MFWSHYFLILFFEVLVLCYFMVFFHSCTGKCMRPPPSSRKQWKKLNFQAGRYFLARMHETEPQWEMRRMVCIRLFKVDHLVLNATQCTKPGRWTNARHFPCLFGSSLPCFSERGRPPPAEPCRSRSMPPVSDTAKICGMLPGISS